MIETKEVKKLSPKELLEKYLATHNVPVAKTVDELYGNSDEGQTQEEIQVEIDNFMRLREEWRKEDKERSFE